MQTAMAQSSARMLQIDRTNQRTCSHSMGALKALTLSITMQISNTTLRWSICVGVCRRVFLYACHRVVVSFCGFMYVSANV
jgi:hypothetical protein